MRDRRSKKFIMAKQNSGQPQSKRKTAIPAGTLSPSWLKGFYPFLWFAVACFILYFRTLSFNYTYLDDHAIILNSMDRIGHLSYIPKAFREDVFHSPQNITLYYRPMLTVSFVLDAVIGGGKFSMFHFSSMIYHLLAVSLLFLCLLELGYERLRSFLFSMIFLVHPVVTMAVAWVPGRNDTLLAIFILASFLFFLRSQKKPGVFGIILHFVFFLAALFTKESALALPVLLAWYVIFTGKRPVKRILLFSAGWLVTALIWLMARMSVIPGAKGTPVSESLLSMVSNLSNIFSFTGKAFFPFFLSVFPLPQDMLIPGILGGVAILLILFMVIRTKPLPLSMMIFGTLWFLLFLLPSFIKVNTPSLEFTEHRVYIPLMGLMIVWMETGLIRDADFRKRIPMACAAGVIVLFGVLTYIHTGHFRDNIAFWKNASETSPSNASAFVNLGSMYYWNQDFPDAGKAFTQALTLNPGEPKANGGLAVILMQAEQYTEAEPYYLKEIKLSPGDENVHFNLGILYYNTGRYDEAVKEWQTTLNINPRHQQAYENLSALLGQLKRFDELEEVRTRAKQAGLP